MKKGIKIKGKVSKQSLAEVLSVRVDEMRNEKDDKATSKRRASYLAGRIDGFESIAFLYCDGEKI